MPRRSYGPAGYVAESSTQGQYDAMASGSAVWRESSVLSLAYHTHNTTVFLSPDCSSRTAALQPINFVTLMRVTNNASCNWVILMQVSSV